MRRLTLLSRSYCHLCQEMEEALRPLATEFGFTVGIVDIDSAPDLESRFNELVPVLLHQELELCHHFLEIAKVRDYLSKIR